jgi:hypothetical protein
MALLLSQEPRRMPIASTRASTAPWTTGSNDCVPESARTQSQLHPPPTQYVEGRCRLGQHGRWSEGQVGDVGDQLDSLRACRGVGEQRPRIEEPPLVGVVLEGDEIQPGFVGHHDLPQRRHWVSGVGDDKGTDPRNG